MNIRNYHRVVAGLLIICGCGHNEAGPESSSSLKPVPDPQSDPRIPAIVENNAHLLDSKPPTEVERFIPSSWAPQKVPTMNGERLVEAKYLIHTQLGDIQVTIGHIKGGAEANINRWIEQMSFDPSDAPVRKRSPVGGIDSHWVDCFGNFGGQLLSSIPPRNCRLIGVIIPRTPKDLAVKIVGPGAAVSGFQPELDRFFGALEFP